MANITCQFNMFVNWCDALAEPRVTLPASDVTVALYMQSAMNGAKTFAPVKASSAAIAFYQKIHLFDHEPTQSPAVCLVRGAAMRKFGLNPKNRKEPFEWDQVVSFVEAYGVRHQGYCHLVVATMAVVMFGGCAGTTTRPACFAGTSASRRTGADSRYPSTSARMRSTDKVTKC